MKVEVEIPDWIMQLNQHDLIIFYIMIIAGVLLVLFSIKMRCPECGFSVFITGLFSSIFGGIGLLILNL